MVSTPQLLTLGKTKSYRKGKTILTEDMSQMQTVFI